jgi:hypothetical protein
MFEVVKILGSWGTSWLKSRVEISETKAKVKQQILVKQAESNADWEKVMAQNMGNSWKDEWILVLWSVPMVLCFIPGMVEYVSAGFSALEATPEWYRVAWGVIISASFGYRTINGLFNKKGS